MIYRLIILTGDRRGEHVTITEEPMTIGRGPACEVRIIDPEMALSHAQVVHRPSGPVINDLGSMNRILVNNREVRQTTLRHGDLVELGRTRFLVQVYVQAEVEGGPFSERRHRWMAFGAAAVLLLAAVVAPVTCHRAKPALPAGPPVAPRVAPPPTPPHASPPAVSKPAPASPSPVVSPSAAVVRVEAHVEPPPSNPPPAAPAAAAATAALVRVTASGAATSAPPEKADVLEQQERELRQAADALAESKVRTLLIQAKDYWAQGAFDRAEAVLTELLWLKPDYAPAIELKARVLERRGRADEARKQWVLLNALTNEARVATAGPPSAPGPEQPQVPAKAPAPVPVVASAPEPTNTAPVVEAVVPVPPPAVTNPPPGLAAQSEAGASVKVDGVEISKFPETEAFRELRLLAIRLAPVSTNALPDTGAVKVEVVFYERHRETGAVAAAPDRSPRAPIAVEGAWNQGEDKVISASYSVPASEPAQRPLQFYGYAVRVLYHGRLQAEFTQPPGLKAATASAAGGQ